MARATPVVRALVQQQGEVGYSTLCRNMSVTALATLLRNLQEQDAHRKTSWTCRVLGQPSSSQRGAKSGVPISPEKRNLYLAAKLEYEVRTRAPKFAPDEKITRGAIAELLEGVADPDTARKRGRERPHEPVHRHQAELADAATLDTTYKVTEGSLPALRVWATARPLGPEKAVSDLKPVKKRKQSNIARKAERAVQAQRDINSTERQLRRLATRS